MSNKYKKTPLWKCLDGLYNKPVNDIKGFEKQRFNREENVMLKFKKLIALTACAMLTTSVALTGCGADKTANAGEGETVKLTWYTIGQTPKDLDMVQEKDRKSVV